MPAVPPFSFYFAGQATRIFASTAQIICPSSYNQTVITTLSYLGKFGIGIVVLHKIEQKFPAVKCFFCWVAPRVYNALTSDQAKLSYTVAGGVSALMGFGAPMAVILVAGTLLALGETSAQIRKKHNAELVLALATGEYTPGLGKQLAYPSIKECLKDALQFAIPVVSTITAVSPAGRVIGLISATVKIISMANDRRNRSILVQEVARASSAQQRGQAKPSHTQRLRSHRHTGGLQGLLSTIARRP